MRVLLLVTTHLSLEHVAFLRKCWPPATHKSSLLREADVTVYISGHLTKNATRALAVAFPPVDRKVVYRRASKMPRVQGGNVMLRQTGAMLGLDTADREGWWSGYDWVVRLNPDVIVRDDTFLRTQMARDDVDAIVANCNKGPDVRVMTDFTAWRPAKVPAGAFRLPAGHTTDCGGRDAWFKEAKCNAEKSATAAFERVLASGRYALLPNAKGPGPHCRVDGRFSSVVHDHAYADRCRADLTRRVYTLPATRRTTERRGACLRWRSEHAVTPDVSWGTLPEALQKKWADYDCDHLVQDAIQREDEAARARTVRRGWNRTAGSRYEFAADGVTFAGSGGI